jgi:phosphatidylinositol-bisphosphatase
VANFVETEQVIFTDDETTSFVQIRGSVPLFWEQPGVQVGSHKVRFARGTEASAPAFDKHMRQMKRNYGSFVIVNLLGSSMLGSKQGEATLSEMFKSHHRASCHHAEFPHILFDYHAECRSGNLKNLSKLRERLGKSMEVFGFYFAKNDKAFSEQKGVVRTNCLDCLDRTNCVQTYLALEVLPKQLQCLGLGEKREASRFMEVYQQMWVTMGNEISRIYAGTGAIQGGNMVRE